MRILDSIGNIDEAYDAEMLLETELTERLTASSPSPWSISSQPPAVDAKPCDCGCSTFWEDLTARVHCCQCRPIPARAMVSDFWTAFPDGWRLYEPSLWNPFEHIDAAAEALDVERADGF